MTEGPAPKWWELTLNSRVVSAYYTDPPSLDAVEVHWIRLSNDAAVIELALELPILPDKPSPRWPKGWNAAQAVVRFIDVRCVTLSGWGTTIVGRLSLEQASDGVRFEFDSPTVQLRGVAGWFDVIGISGYVKGAL